MKTFPPAIDWSNWGSLMGDAELFAPLAQEVCRRHSLLVEPIRPAYPGTHAVFYLGDRSVVKFYAPLGLPDREIELAAYLSAADGLLPRLVARGEVSSGGHRFPYIVNERKKGLPMREARARLSAAAKDSAARFLAGWISRYAAAAAPLPAGHPLSAADWPAALADNLEGNRRALAEAGWPLGVVSRAAALCETAYRSQPLRWVHGDLTEDHLLMAEGELNVIDPADSRMAPPDYDLAPLWFSMLRGERPLAEAILGPLTAERILAATMMHKYGALTLIQSLGAAPESFDALLAACLGFGEAKIRPATKADAPALLAIYAPYVLNTAISFETEVPTLEDFTDRIGKIAAFYPYLVVERAGVVLGYAYASRFQPRAAYDWAAEVTVYLRSDARGGGLGRLLYQALESALLAQNVCNLYACIASVEVEDEYLTCASQRFHEKLGYRLVGTFRSCGFKFGRWYDMVWMEKLIAPHASSPRPIQPYQPGRNE